MLEIIEESKLSYAAAEECIRMKKALSNPLVYEYFACLSKPANKLARDMSPENALMLYKASAFVAGSLSNKPNWNDVLTQACKNLAIYTTVLVELDNSKIIARDKILSTYVVVSTEAKAALIGSKFTLSKYFGKNLKNFMKESKLNDIWNECFAIGRNSCS